MEERKEGRKEEVILINVQTPSWQVGKHIGWNKMENNKDGEITHCFYVFFSYVFPCNTLLYWHLRVAVPQILCLIGVSSILQILIFDRE